MNSDKSLPIELPFLKEASEEFRSDFEASVIRVQLTPGQYICMEQDQCQGLPIVITGTARVYKMSESGRELTLYRIDPGESCILTASCLASGINFPAFAVAETEVDAWYVPASAYGRWLDTHLEWRRYVFDLFARRIDSVIELVEEIAFHKMDSRLAAFLVDNADRESSVLSRTHELIASELGTSREVVSRLLKEFEKQKAVELSRGSILICDKPKLSRISRGG